jgi:hypothetical protein
MIRKERPGVHRKPGVLHQRRQTRDKVCPISVAPKDLAPFNPPHHHVVEDAGRIEAWLARHGRNSNRYCFICQRPLYFFSVIDHLPQLIQQLE